MRITVREQLRRSDMDWARAQLGLQSVSITDYIADFAWILDTSFLREQPEQVKTCETTQSVKTSGLHCLDCTNYGRGCG